MLEPEQTAENSRSILGLHQTSHNSRDIAELRASIAELRGVVEQGHRPAKTEDPPQVPTNLN